MSLTDLRWQRRAACRTEDPALFFAADVENPGARQAREASAKAICSGCPVRIPCLEYRLADEYQGDGAIWGGEDEYERKRIRRNRMRAQGRAALCLTEPGRRPVAVMAP